MCLPQPRIKISGEEWYIKKSVLIFLPMRTMKYTEKIRKQDLKHYIEPYHDEIFAHQPQLRIVC